MSDENINKKYLFLIITIIVFMNFNAVGLNRYDSLKLQITNNDPKKNIQIYLKIATLFQTENLDSALFYINKSKELCKEYGNEEQLAIVCALLGEVHMNRADYTKAWYYHDKASEL